MSGLFPIAGIYITKFSQMFTKRKIKLPGISTFQADPGIAARKVISPPKKKGDLALLNQIVKPARTGTR